MSRGNLLLCPTFWIMMYFFKLIIIKPGIFIHSLHQI
jgi:hypothetical protein